jgi:deazaflavin-dependent oxidoreductase (nitroreductase family)
MPIEGEYEPNKLKWVREHVADFEASGGATGGDLHPSGVPIIIVTMMGNKSGKVRKIALMRVEHEGSFALVASMGGAPKNPGWYHNLVANPNIMIQDGPQPADFTVRVGAGDERDEWWERCVSVFAPYAEYQEKTDRVIPVFIAELAAT